MTQKSRPGRCFLLSVPCHSRSRKRFTLPSSFVAGFVFLQHIGWGLGGRYHGWDLGCSGRTDGVWVDDIMVGTWMLWQNGWDLGGRYHGGTWMLWQNGCGLGGRYHGWDLDALAERMGSGWTISWLGPGCSGRTDGVWVDDIMVGTWMLWQNGWGLGGNHDIVHDIMVGTWMLWQNGCGLGGRYHGWDLDALAERMGFGWTIS